MLVNYLFYLQNIDRKYSIFIILSHRGNLKLHLSFEITVSLGTFFLTFTWVSDQELSGVGFVYRNLITIQILIDFILKTQSFFMWTFIV